VREIIRFSEKVSIVFILSGVMRLDLLLEAIVCNQAQQDLWHYSINYGMPKISQLIANPQINLPYNIEGSQ